MPGEGAVLVGRHVGYLAAPAQLAEPDDANGQRAPVERDGLPGEDHSERASTCEHAEHEKFSTSPRKGTTGDNIAMTTHLLIIEDDPTIGEVLTTSLRVHGYEVVWEHSGKKGLAQAAVRAFDLALLDLGLPDIDGIDVCRQLRHAQPACVVVMLTARSAEMDVVVGLEAGADDYLFKPVRLGELLARVRAHLRRNEGLGRSVRPVGDLVIDLSRRRATVAGRELQLRPKEFDLLARLAAEPDAALSREKLMTDVWDERWFGSTKTLDVHIAALRRKIAKAASEAARVPKIVTVRGHGYMLATTHCEG
jgi:DNA-binding response OmpR family regulator